MNNRKSIFIISLIVVMGFSCSKKSDKIIEQMLFSYDSTRVEKSDCLAISGLKMNPPRGMKEVTAQLEDKDEVLNKIPFPLEKGSCRIFFNRSIQGVLITSVSNFDLEERKRNVLNNTELKLVSQKNFLSGNLHFQQYMYSDSRNIMLVILIPYQEAVIDIIYMVPIDNYNEYAKNIESSLGSIQ